jgi:hypothetical protein
LSLRTIPIASTTPAPAPCRGCGGGDEAAPCGATLRGLPCAAPRLDGPPELLGRVLGELTRVLDAEAGGCVSARDFVHALRLEDGEAELRLGVLPDAAGRALMDTAFQTLRRLLPDTDIYVCQQA